MTTSQMQMAVDDVLATIGEAFERAQDPDLTPEQHEAAHRKLGEAAAYAHGRLSAFGSNATARLPASAETPGVESAGHD